MEELLRDAFSREGHRTFHVGQVDGDRAEFVLGGGERVVRRFSVGAGGRITFNPGVSAMSQFRTTSTRPPRAAAHAEQRPELRVYDVIRELDRTDPQVASTLAGGDGQAEPPGPGAGASRGGAAGGE